MTGDCCIFKFLRHGGVDAVFDAFSECNLCFQITLSGRGLRECTHLTHSLNLSFFPINRCYYYLPSLLNSFTVRLLKPGPPRQRKPITRQNRIPTFSNPANQMSYFQFQPIKCLVKKNDEIFNLVVVMLTRLRCQARTVGTFECLRAFSGAVG